MKSLNVECSDIEKVPEDVRLKQALTNADVLDLCSDQPIQHSQWWDYGS